MDWIGKLILTVEGLVFLGLFVLTIILGIRAFNKRGEETFEDRDN